MTRGCTAPIAWADLVDYWAGDLPVDREDALDAHLLGCASCSASSARLAAITEAVRGLIPPVISSELLAQLQRRGLSVLENPMLPGERRWVDFPRDVDVLLHRLTGLPLADATRVDFRLIAESTGALMIELDDVPFDRATGSVLIACQRHYASMPHDTIAETRVRSAGGEEVVQRFTILHRFG